MIRTGAREDPSDEARLASLLLRRIITRGDAPPVDPQVERELLVRANLHGHLARPLAIGDLCPRLRPDAPVPAVAEMMLAATHRGAFAFEDRMELDGEPLVHPEAELPFLTEGLAAEFGPSIGHWVVPQAPLDQLCGQVGQDHAGRRVDFLLSRPGMEPVVVEVDGSQHHDGKAVDDARDAVLRAAGYVVERVPATGVTRSGLARKLSGWAVVSDRRPTEAELTLAWGPAVANRVALGLVEALDQGWLAGDRWSVRLAEPLGIGVLAVRSFLEQLAAIDAVYGLGIAPDCATVHLGDEPIELARQSAVTYEQRTTRDDPPPHVGIDIDPFSGPFHQLPTDHETRQIVIRSTHLPIRITDARLGGGARRHVRDIDSVPSEALTRLLQAIFAKESFRPRDEDPPRRQEIALRRLLADRDAVVLLPTGAGKSLIYQLAGMLRPGTTLVVDPIISLIDDQVDGLREHGIDRAVGISSAAKVVIDAKLARIRSGEALFSFIAPERLQSKDFRNAIKALAVASPVSLAVVDEAHCVSEWGHDFRTAYLAMGRTLRELCADATGTPPVIPGLTGTASRSVLRDALVELEVDRSDPDLLITPASFDRPELKFNIVKATDKDAMFKLIGVLRSLPERFGESPGEFFQPRGDDTTAGIIFCPTVNGATGVAKVLAALESELNVAINWYSGTPMNGFAGNFADAKRSQALSFKSNSASIMVATKAYGMGIDKPNVRWTIHLGMPNSIEAFYQEAGRAGRDGREAFCTLIHHPAARDFHDWTRGNAYPGIPSELAALRRTLQAVGDLGARSEVKVPFPDGDEARKQVERAIFRLRVIGVVRDYTVEWGGQYFNLETGMPSIESVFESVIAYVRRAEPGRVRWAKDELHRGSQDGLREAILWAGHVLLTYVYDTVVPARERAADEIQELADRSTTDADIRSAVLKYLELGRIGQNLDAIVDEEPFDAPTWTALLAGVLTVDDAMELRGSSARMLESAPFHPGLLLGRAVSELLLTSGEPTAFERNVSSLFRDAPDRYALEPSDIEHLGTWLAKHTHDHRADWAHLVYVALDEARPTDRLRYLKNAERHAISDVAVADATELAITLSRRLDRISGVLSQHVHAMRQ